MSTLFCIIFIRQQRTCWCIMLPSSWDTLLPCDNFSCGWPVVLKFYLPRKEGSYWIWMVAPTVWEKGLKYVFCRMLVFFPILIIRLLLCSLFNSGSKCTNISRFWGGQTWAYFWFRKFFFFNWIPHQNLSLHLLIRFQISLTFFKL